MRVSPTGGRACYFPAFNPALNMQACDGNVSTFPQDRGRPSRCLKLFRFLICNLRNLRCRAQDTCRATSPGAHEAKKVTARDQGLPVREIDVLWMTAGLRCDGCSVAMTAAARPGPMDFRGGRLHRTPKVPLDFLSFNVENGRAAACPVTGAAGPVANESDGPPVVFRSVGSKRFFAVPTHKLAKTALGEP